MLAKKNKFLFLFVFFYACSVNKEHANIDIYLKNASELEFGANTKATIEAYKKIIAISPKSEHAKLAIYKISKLYQDSGAFKEALKYLKLYIDVVKLSSTELYEINSQLGDIYYDMFLDYQNALSYYQVAMENSFEKKQLFFSSFNIAKSYFAMLNFELAVKFFEKATLSVDEKIDKYKVQEVLYYLSYSKIMFTKETKDAYVSTGYGYFDKEDIDSVLKSIGECIKIDEFSKYGLMCKYLSVDFFVENDDKDKALEVLKDLRPYYPSQTVIEYRIKQLEGQI